MEWGFTPQKALGFLGAEQFRDWLKPFTLLILREMRAKYFTYRGNGISPT